MYTRVGYAEVAVCGTHGEFVGEQSMAWGDGISLGL